MELLVATWSLRLALVAALAVGGFALSGGATVIDAVDRAALAALVFTLAGRWFIGFLETPEQRLARLRARRVRRSRDAKAGKSDKKPGRHAASAGLDRTA